MYKILDGQFNEVGLCDRFINAIDMARRYSCKNDIGAIIYEVETGLYVFFFCGNQITSFLTREEVEVWLTDDTPDYLLKDDNLGDYTSRKYYN